MRPPLVLLPGWGRRMAKYCLLVLSFVLASAGLATAAFDTNVERSEDGSTAPVAGAILPGPPSWWPCGEATATVECTLLEVPLDQSDPKSRLVQLRVSRIPALDDERRIGALVAIAGGPGQRGTDGVWPGAHIASIQDRFDIVSWDPRGTSGESLIDCIPEWDPFVGVDRTPDNALERQTLDEMTATLARRCRDAHGDLLPFVGTVETARDLERLRLMLGEPQISILGSSYGSQVAVVYATLFPDRVRALVLDGYSDPNLSPGDREIEQASAFERELDELLAQCATDSSCPFHSEGRPAQALDRLLKRLDASPVSADGVGLGSVGQSDAHEAIVGSLTRDAPARKRLLEALASAAKGHGGQLLSIANDIRRSYEASGLTQGAFMAVYCADASDYWTSLSPAEVDDLAKRVRDVAPRLGAWLWSPSSGAGLPPVGLCAMQTDVAELQFDTFDAAGAGPILVLATTGDPATPIAAARRSVDDLEHATLLTLEENHHLAYPYALADPDRPSYRCVLDALEVFLVDLVLPRPGATCSP